MVQFSYLFTTFYNILQHFTTFYYILLHFTTFFYIYYILLHFTTFFRHLTTECMQTKMEIKSNTIQNATMITFKEERMKIKSNSPQKSLWITCTQKKVKIESTSPQKGMWITCTQKAQIMSNSIQNIMVISNHLHVEEGKGQVNPEPHDDHFQGGEGEDPTLPRKPCRSP